MWRLRITYTLVLLGLAAVACGGQAVPDRRPFEVPEAIVPDAVSPTDPASLFPESGECTIALSTGVRVLDIIAESGAEGLLQAGDIITSIDGVAIDSREELLGAMDGRQVGESVEVLGSRGGVGFEFDLTLGASAEDPERAIMGVVSESRLEPAGPTEVTDTSLVHRFSRPAVLDGQIYLFEPLGGAWAQYPGVPAAQMAALGSDFFSTASDQSSRALVRIGDGALIPIETSTFFADAGTGPVALTPSAFERVLASVGNLLLVGGWASDENGGVTSVVYAVDPVTQTVRWNQPLGLAESGNPFLAFEGYRSPAGDRAVIGLVELDVSTGATSDVFTYFLLDEAGNGTVPPGRELLQPTARVTGWFDDESVTYVLPLELPQVVQWSVGSGEQGVVLTIREEDARQLVSVTPVGDGRHVVQILQGSVSLIDTDQLVFARPISRGCQHNPIGGLAG